MIGNMKLSVAMPYLKLIAEVNGLKLSRLKDFSTCRKIMENMASC